MADQSSSAGFDRRGSLRHSVPPQLQQGDDEYDLEAMGIPDGFRPSDVAIAHSRAPSNTSQLVQPLGGRSPPQRSSSESKPKGPESFALRHDGMMGPMSAGNAGVSSSSNTMPIRSSNVSINTTFVRAESPYRGPAGPSHPYQAYPQESRLASMATSSASPETEGSYIGPSGPTHPYGMYPQNTVPEAESVLEQHQNAPIPVGFPGLNNDYQRRLGADGEEIADIIGPDGHTEQLPPYSQYPDESLARKTRTAAQLPGIVAGAGGLGLATRNPEFASRENLNSPQSRQSTRSLMSESSNHQVNTAAFGASEKPELKKWQLLARRKIWRIVPVWAIVLAACILVLFGIILGSVLSALRPHHPPDSQNSDPDYQTTVYATLTTTFDATPFTAVPSGIPLLPTGTFALPITTPSTIQNSCLDSMAQSSAWSCSIPPTSLQMIVTGSPGQGNVVHNEISISLGNDSFSFFPYGTQAPTVKKAQVMNLVTDSQDPERGPAWFFQMPYDKVVIVHEDDLTRSNSKRSFERHSTTPNFSRTGVAQAGDKPWFCYWNSTLLEAFIYVNMASSAGSQSTLTASSNAPTGTAGPVQDPSRQAAATSTHLSHVPSSTVQSYGSSSSVSFDEPLFLGYYPLVYKVEERRIPMGAHTVSPYCIQNVIASDGTAKPYMDSSNEVVAIYLNETVPLVVAPMFDKRNILGTLEGHGKGLSQRGSTKSCGCVWLAT